MATVLSLLLCVATVALWVRNRTSSEEWVWCDTHPPTTWPCPRIPLLGPAPPTTAAWSFSAIIVTRGQAWFTNGRYVTFDSPPGQPYFLPPDHDLHWRRPAPLADHTVRGLSGFMSTTLGASSVDAQFVQQVGGWPGASYHARETGFGVPLWWLILSAAVLPLCRLVAAFRRPRARPGRCPACGYDLRATPDRCPERGAVPEAKRGPVLVRSVRPPST